jgi:hypothetical protein
MGVLSARSQENVLRTDIDPRTSHSITGVTITDDGSCLHKRFANINVHFKHDDYRLYLDYMGNEASLENFAYRIETIGLANIDSVVVISQSSPEGVYEHNVWLSKNRAGTMRRYLLDRFPGLSDRLYVHADGESWQQLREYVKNDSLMKNSTKEKVIKVIDSDVNIGTKKWRLEQLPIFRYLYITYYPRIRNSAICILYYNDIKDPVEEFPEAVVELDEGLVAYYVPVPLYPMPEPFIGIKTNLLYDALLVPNLGVEFSLGKGFSLAANWMYSWWKSDRTPWYWRVYGGDVALRWWFGRQAKERPLTGHHIGVYAQALTYDFLVDDKGYMAGEPGGDIFDKANYAAGLEYGYSLQLNRSFNLDFTLGVGYMWGKYYEYKPIDDCYVHQVTKARNYFGPTKVEISLVWLLNHRPKGNKEKGGGR